MSTKTCPTCKKSVTLRKECEEEGVAYHCNCFRCRICKAPLNEYNVKIREGKLYCDHHSIFQEGLQPFCKIYFNNIHMCYRVIYAGDKEGNS